MTDHDPVSAPSHYRWLPVEVIEITEHLNFCMGNVVKYVLRTDHKGKPIEDLKKARYYIDREIARREAITYDLRPGQRLATDDEVEIALGLVDAIKRDVDSLRDCVAFERCGRENCWYCG